MSKLIIKLDEVTVPKETPFANDKFEREPYAQSLRSLALSCAETGCVLSINGGWGVGKTTFIRMWGQYMRNAGHPVICFNAWESDFSEDPLVPMLAELSRLNSDDDTFAKCISPVLSIVTESICQKVLGVSTEKIDEELSGDKLIRGYLAQKEKFDAFRSKLSEYVANIGECELPVVFIIDELDRCNPSYAVKVLEHIKHIFDVPNIFFVLAINKEQLEYAVKGYYGSEAIDAINYLRRFIDVEFNMPPLPMHKACDYLYEHYDFHSYFYTKQSSGAGLEESFKYLLSMIIQRGDMDFRTLGKLCSYTRLVFMTLDGCRSVADVMLLLCYLRTGHKDLYERIKGHQLSLLDVYFELERMFLGDVAMPSISRADSFMLLETLSKLLWIYNYPTPYKAVEGWLNSLQSDSVLDRTSIHFSNKELVESLVFCINVRNNRITLPDIVRRLELATAFSLNEDA
jgi:hypothetical protein